MLKAILFYLVIWWFKKTENKISLIIRAILVGIFGLSCLFSAIEMAKCDLTGLMLSVILGFVLFILFAVKVVSDVKNYAPLKLTIIKFPIVKIKMKSKNVQI